MDSGDEHDVPDSRGRKKRYHRHTQRQIQDLESMFKVCPHPDEKQRMQLSRDLGLEPRQIKFWFQNRRTQMKAQQDRSGNCWLRAENDKIRCENIAMRAALKNVICPSCGSSSCTEDSYFDEQKLRMDNSRLKEELDRVSGLASRYLGRPITQLPPVQSVSISSLELSVGSYNYNPGISTSLDLDLDGDLLLRNSSSFPRASITELEKPLMMEMASNAMEEVVRLVQADEPLWVKSGRSDGREILQLETYDRMFKRSSHQLKFPDVVRIEEASRDSAVVVMDATTLINIFMDASKWAELFPTIVSKARTLDVLASGMAQSRSGSLALIYEELQVLSPAVPTREFCFLRCCQQIQQGVWVVADVSVDYPRANELAPFSQSKRLPSGCLIEEMADGCYSKVTWVEHVEIEESNQIPVLFKDLIDSGLAFGAQRWLTALQRMCDRLSCLSIAGLPARELGVAPSPDGKRSMMKLAQRMVNNFCANISASNDHKWMALPGLNDAGVRVILHKSTDAGQPSGVLLSAATTIWFPISPESIFIFFKDERTRAQWDVLSNGNTVREVTHITTGSHPGNCISLLRGLNSGQNTMLILQECCTDALGSVVVYSPIDVPAINIVMSGEDTSSVSLLPSGFTILPDGRSAGGQGASCSSNPRGGSSGSLVTVAFQILMSSLPSAKLNMESVMTVNNLIGTTVQQIKAALNCPDI